MTPLSGTPSEPTVNPPAKKFDPPTSRRSIRITNIYSTRWEAIRRPDTRGDLTRHLRFGRLSRYVNYAQDQLPRIADRLALNPKRLTFRRWQPNGDLLHARLWTMHMPSGQVVVALTLDVTAGPLETIDLLEDCYYLDITMGGVDFETFACERAAREGLHRVGQVFEPERHQIVFSAALPGEQAEDVAQKLIYRSDLPYRKEFSAITYPAELNRRPGAAVAVGPYVSVLSGQQDYIENCAFISAAQAVASWARLRTIRDEAYEDLRLFRRSEQGDRSLPVRRRLLERMADQLSNLELELSYSVESAADLEILVPSLRVASYHNALFDCMGLCAKADTVGRMLQRLDRSIRAELTSIESVERRADEDRRLRWAVAAGFLSTVALPITLVLAFFGVNAKEVDARFSMFDDRYRPLYLFVGLVVSLGLVLLLGLHLQQRLAAWKDRRPARRAAVSVPHIAAPRQPTNWESSEQLGRH